MDRASIKIMVVNDKVDLRDIMRDYLRQDGYTGLSVSENGRSALRRIVAEPPDLIIADYELPELNGLELLRRVRQDRSLADTPFILISSEAEQKYVAQAAESGVNAFVVKPFSHKTLSDKIEKLLKHKLNPPESHVFFEEANRLAQSGNLEAALARYQEALLATQGAMASLHYKVGQLHEKLSDENMAEAEYRMSLSLSDLFVPAYDAMGLLNQRRYGADQSLEFFRRGAEISPLNAERQMNLGEALLEAGHDEEAEKAFKYALELDPTQTHAFNRIAVALRRQDKPEEAETYFLKAIDAAKDDENLYYNLSRVYIDLGRLDEARECLKTAMELNPEFKEAIELWERVRDRSTP